MKNKVIVVSDKTQDEIFVYLSQENYEENHCTVTIGKANTQDILNSLQNLGYEIELKIKE